MTRDCFQIPGNSLIKKDKMTHFYLFKTIPIGIVSGIFSVNNQR